MKRRQTTVLLLSMALVITSLSGCAREDLAEVRSKTQTDAVQEEVLLEQWETAGSGIPSYADYLEMNDGAAFGRCIHRDPGRAFFARGSQQCLCGGIYGKRRLPVLGYASGKCFLGI